VQKNETQTPSPFAPPTPATHSSWDSFAVECVDWMMARAHAGVLARSALAEGRLLALFDVFQSWTDGRDAVAADVVGSVLDLSDRHPVGRIVALQAPAVRAILVDLGRQAGLVDVEDFADSWLVLVGGTVQRVAGGDSAAPARAGAMATDLMARHRPRVVATEPSAYDEDSEFGWVGSDARSGSTVSPRTIDGAETGSFDWFDVYGWDGELAAPVARVA
jgi:hypothetical protein